MRRSVESLGETFLERVFTPGEISYCSARADSHQHYAARFASKEAVSKAMATGWAGGFRWLDVEVRNTPAGKPEVLLHGRMARILADSRILLSISHSETHVVAVAVIESAPSA